MWVDANSIVGPHPLLEAKRDLVLWSQILATRDPESLFFDDLTYLVISPGGKRALQVFRNGEIYSVYARPDGRGYPIPEGECLFSEEEAKRLAASYGKGFRAIRSPELAEIRVKALIEEIDSLEFW